MSNLRALILPFGLMCLNSKLLKAARPWWYFGFFFINFVFQRVSGEALVQF